MAETEKTKKPAAKKVEAAAAPKAKPAKVEAAPAPKAKPAGKTVTVTQTGGTAGRPEWAEQTLIGLGLNKRHRTRVLQDTPEVRGMIRRVAHLVRVEETSKTGT